MPDSGKRLLIAGAEAMIGVVVMPHSQPHITAEERVMVTPKVTELSRLSAHQRQVAYVRASLLRGVSYEREAGRAGKGLR